MSEYALQMKQITKAFGAVQANDHIDLNVERGTIHALLGENGSGKSTLMNILFGLVPMDSGEIWIDGRSVQIRSPLDAIQYGIGMIHQEFMLIPGLSVQDNLSVSILEKRKSAGLRELQEGSQEIAEKFGLKELLKRPANSLSTGEQQKLEIAKALYQGAETIILDEPTSVLTPIESVLLFEILKQLAGEGKTILVITHKLEEVLRYSQEVTILRAGRRAAFFKTAETNKYQLAEEMVGQKHLFESKERKSAPGETADRVEGLELGTYSIGRGSMLGLAGVDGNGQRELAEVLAGIRRPDRGIYEIEGQSVARYNPRRLADRGVAFVPGERNNCGCVSALPIRENTILKRFNRRPYCRRGIMDWKSVEAFANALIHQYRIKAPDSHTRAGALSGGNLQKVILARELSAEPRFLICVQPTRGLDIGAVSYVQDVLLKARESGVSILLISTDLDEILALSDRIAVISRGRIVDIMENQENVDVGLIGLMMAGGKKPQELMVGSEGI